MFWKIYRNRPKLYIEKLTNSKLNYVGLNINIIVIRFCLSNFNSTFYCEMKRIIETDILYKNTIAKRKISSFLLTS